MEFPSTDQKAALSILIDELKDRSRSVFSSGNGSADNGRSEIIALAKKVIWTIMEPSDLPSQQSAHMHELIVIRTLMDRDVLTKIPHDGSISLRELADSVEMQDNLLERLLRPAVGTGFLHQTEALEYRHTKFSQAYTSTAGDFFTLLYDNSFRCLYRLHEYLRDRDSWTEPDDPAFNPATWMHGQDGKSYFEIIAQYPEKAKMFDRGMAHMEASVPATGFYDFGRLNTADDRPILVDIGGGRGQAISAILNKHPDLDSHKFVLQDLPGPLARARKSGRLPDSVVIMEHDFFTEQPVKGAKCYYLRRVIHDYPDEYSIQILKNIVPAMSSDSIVLIADVVLRDRVTEVDLPAWTMDMNVLSIAGKERTVTGFVKIIEASGLEFVKVHRAQAGVAALIEARLARSYESPSESKWLRSWNL